MSAGVPVVVIVDHVHEFIEHPPETAGGRGVLVCYCGLWLPRPS